MFYVEGLIVKILDLANQKPTSTTITKQMQPQKIRSGESVAVPQSI